MKKNVIIFGYGLSGIEIYRKLQGNEIYDVIGFADNSIYKQGKYVNNLLIFSLEGLIELKERRDFAVIIAARSWHEIGAQLEKNKIQIAGIYINGNIGPYKVADFEKLNLQDEIKLYAGDICDEVHMSEKDLYGLSINKADEKHIFHDITQKYPLPDESIYAYQAEDVLEHIEIEKVVPALNEIYRILRKGSVLRICLPDYNSPHLSQISLKDHTGRILFDPTGGGVMGEFGVEKGGHVWFPTYDLVKKLLEETTFEKVDFLCYHTANGELVKKNFDYLNGYVNRVSDTEDGREIYSMIVDCQK